VAAGQGRVHEGARAQESDQARRLVQLAVVAKPSEEKSEPARRRKMREAQFFYWKIVAAADPSSAEPPEAFNSYFSAFLCAAYSVTDTAKNEVREGGSLIAAWRDEMVSLEGQKFLRAMQDSRRAELHFSGVEVNEQSYHFPDDAFRQLSGLRLVPERFLVAGDRQYGAITACARYLGLLADLLKYIDTKSKPTV